MENMKFMESLQLVATPISKTKPKKKLCTSINPPVNLSSPVKSVVLEQGIADTVPTSEAQIFELGTTIAGDLPVKTITVPTVETGMDIPEVLRVDSNAPPFQPTFAGHDVSIIKVVLDCNEAASEECVDFEDKPLETAPDLNAVLVLQHRVAMLESEIGALRRDNAKLRSLNMRLQETLVERPNGTSFTEIPGFPDAKWLLSVSQNAQDSDYLFVKELVVRLFPLGVGNATVSGHPSNNPFGRGIKNGLEPDARTNVGRLDPVKVTYIRDRLYERRTILQDELGVAMQRSRKTAKHIAAVINNNPSLRTLRQE
ncbi:uncharacterized protein LOC110675115 [Aedes aegypti]|uniref:Uncharacterized protein n=1 Tax=Aedes aegypti TaxID=7159 RepID=A0A6I8TW22_AEDAE|nr:uncharacterized protein LOC110675115 [Aedes aegypti]